MQDTVMSVQGPVDASALQWVYPHEHLIANMEERKGEDSFRYTGHIGFLRRMLLGMLQELPPLGVNGLVDPLPMGIGLDANYARFASDLSREAGVWIFLATGLYVPEFWPPWAHEWPITRIADRFTHDLEQGFSDTGIRPAIIKQAVGGPFVADHEKSLTAAAIAQRRTGASVHIHTTSCRREIVELLTGLGVPGSRIYLAHVDMNTSEEEFLWLAEQGVRLVTTNWDFPHHMNQDEARRLLRLLIDRGYIDNILVSIDFALYIVTRWMVGIANWDNADRTSFAYLQNAVIPKLRGAGFTNDELNHIMRDNSIEMLRRR
ncbi:MAG: phosphotriesterase family protein [Anaerolineae bacterium]